MEVFICTVQILEKTLFIILVMVILEVQNHLHLMRSMKRTTWMNLAVCDKRDSVVLEITPKHVVARRPRNGLLPCTNHFRTPDLAVRQSCWRYQRLDGLLQESFDVADVARILHSVNQRSHTLQSMIFEPATMKLHVSIGKAPVTARPMKTLDLAKLFQHTVE